MTKGVNELSLEMVWLRPESDCLGQADGWEMAPAPFSRSMSPRAAGRLLNEWLLGRVDVSHWEP